MNCSNCVICNEAQPRKDEIRASVGEPAETTVTAKVTPTATPAKSKIATATATLADAAYIFGLVLGSDQPLEALVVALRERVEALRDPLSQEAAAELQKHLPLLDAVFMRFVAEATRTRKGSVHQTMLLRAALQAQQAHARTFALLHMLAIQAKGANSPRAITLHDDASNDH